MANESRFFQKDSNAFGPSDVLFSMMTDRPEGGGSYSHLVGAPKSVTGASAEQPIVCTVIAHGYNDGDIIGQNDNTNSAANGVFIVANKTDDTFELTTMSGSHIDGRAQPDGGGGFSLPAFAYRPGPTKVAMIKKLNLVAGSATSRADQYLGLPQLANGLSLQLWNGDGFMDAIAPLRIKKFCDWANIDFVDTGTSGFGASDVERVLHATFESFGGSLLLDGTKHETLVLRIEDDMTGLLFEQSSVSGIIEEALS